MPGQSDDEYWSGTGDPYTHPETGILKNVPALETQIQLDTFEALVFQANFPSAQYHAAGKTPDLTLWREIHRICFGDVYAWAGKIRTIRISKGNAVFAYPEHIESEAGKLFAEYKGLVHKKTVTFEKLDWLAGELNVIHPFREGNGRTLRIILESMLNQNGYDVDYNLTTQEEQIQAFRESFNGNNEPLEALFRKLTRKR